MALSSADLPWVTCKAETPWAAPYLASCSQETDTVCSLQMGRLQESQGRPLQPSRGSVRQALSAGLPWWGSSCASLTPVTVCGHHTVDAAPPVMERAQQGRCVQVRPGSRGDGSECHSRPADESLGAQSTGRRTVTHAAPSRPPAWQRRASVHDVLHSFGTSLHPPPLKTVLITHVSPGLGGKPTF